MNKILNAYLECALWSSIGDDCEPLDKNHTIESFSFDAKIKANCDIRNFLEFLEMREIDWRENWSEEQFGHDFWLTRNGHGAGFWDRGFPLGNTLKDCAKAFGSSDCYVGDDGKVDLT
jgi:hypothetical protein